MSTERSFKRSQMKKKYGAKRVQPIWEKSQIKKYGFAKWWDMRVDCDPKGRRAITLCR